MWFLIGGLGKLLSVLTHKRVKFAIPLSYTTAIIKSCTAIEYLNQITSLVVQLSKLGIWAARRCHDVASKPGHAAVRVSVEYSIEPELQKILVCAHLGKLTSETIYDPVVTLQASAFST